MGVLDLFFPKLCVGCRSEGRYICERCGTQVVRVGDSLRYTGVVRRALKEIKYRGTYDMVQELVALWKPVKPKGEAVVTSVPMWEGKERSRGYNQAELIAREVASRWGLEYKELLRRTRQTKPMYGLSRAERRENIRNAFSISANFKQEILSKCVILIDDVWTSGATTRECARVLKRAGVKEVCVITLAR